MITFLIGFVVGFACGIALATVYAALRAASGEPLRTAGRAGAVADASERRAQSDGNGGTVV